MTQATVTASLLLVAGLCAAADPVQAQVPGRNLGIGGQLGDPSGLTLKLYRHPGFAYDFLLAWDLDDDAFFLNLHGLYERPLQDTPLRYYLGPGVYVGVRDRPGASDTFVGISGNFGINYFIERFELFGQLTPRLRLAPSTDGDLGGGIGLRYYL